MASRSSIFRWLVPTRAASRYASGYDWAAGRMLKGATPDALEREHQGMIWEHDEFDRGIQDAIATWRKMLEALS